MAWGYSLEGQADHQRPLGDGGGQALVSGRDAPAALLIPASCYFEWEKDREGRVKYAIGPREGGLCTWRVSTAWSGEEALVPAFAVLTREAAPQLAFIHHRMPVVLSPQSAGDWLDIGRPAEQVLVQARLDLVLARLRAQEYG